MSFQLPSTILTIKPEWIDHNGHMNVAYYVLAFDLATDNFYDEIGIGMAHQASGQSVFTLGMNVDYMRELFVDEQVRIVTHLIDVDHKRVHYIHCMYHAAEGYLAATNECLGMNVNFESRRSSPFTTSLQQSLYQQLASHQSIPLPAQVGRTLEIKRG